MEPRRPPETKRPRGLVGFAWAVLAVAGILLLVRGVLPGLAFSGDFTMIHAGASVWLDGGNPYDFDTLYNGWKADGGGSERPREERWFVALYPPTTYAALAPVGALGWPAGRAAWVLLSGLSVAGVAAWGAAWLRRNPTHPPRGVAPERARPWLVLLLAAWLSAGPVATTLEFGQLGLVVLALVALAVGTPGWRPPAWAAGAALAGAGCVKPQLAGVFALGFVALGRWRELAWTLGVGSAIAAVAVLRLEAAGVAWATGLLDNVRRFAGTGFADPSPANRVAWQMVNLEPLWRRFFSGGAPVGVAAVWAVAAAGVAWRVRKRAGPAGGFTLWVMSVASVVTLLIAYHRAYDAVLLAVPAVWAVRGLLAGGRLAPAAVLVGVAFFWPPVPELLNHLAFRGWLPRSQRWPFVLETAVMFHRPGVLVGVLGVLLGVRSRPGDGRTR
ncbi:glycosyltransferase 87 family protein [Phycisphaera mikurensis]|uniref:glycosyltransferase 87 family protein n=1 Tax=Phycisphaera mikurensis TaxID=547188 RepID=UPI0012B5B08C|nr:glycosyltransferase 87 family protein [Phycisphaera mikurensis]MBB6441758.1 hypothetical protein [Phycisphaera mikurensis]